MRKIGAGAGAYVRKVRQQTQRYVERLLKENERLRLLEASNQGRQARLREEIEETRQELHRSESEKQSLQSRVGDVEEESRTFVEQYIEVEQQNTNLAKLYVASYRLHGTLDRDEVLDTIEDIVANLIGSEELAIFELAPDGFALSLAASRGIDSARYRRIPLGRGRIGETAQTGEVFLADLEEEATTRLPEERNLTACIPLTLDDRVIGEIAIFRLLPQKERFDEFDEELFEFLAKHAATAFYCAGLHSRQQQVTA